MIYSLAVSTVFQTFVSSFLVDPGLEKQISNVEDILQSRIKYGLYRTFDIFLESLPQNQKDVITNHKDSCVNITECAQKVANEGNYATILATVTAEYLNTYKTVDSSGAGLLYLLKEENVWTNFQTFIVPRGSEFLDTFNRLVGVAQEAGLVTHFWKDMLSTSALKSGSIRLHTALDDYTAFTLAYLQSAFYLLLLGHFTALCLFLTELLYHRWAMRGRRKAAGDVQHRTMRRRRTETWSRLTRH